MSVNDRLIEITKALTQAGVRFLVMGGHAVRYYGVDRNTIDFDFHVHGDEAPSLTQRLLQTEIFQKSVPIEGPSWRISDFRRYQIGVLPNGREEWLEFWFRGHLLAPFEELYGRRELGEVDGKTLPFLSLPDLIRSKETEREDDWRDVALLEEVLDNRNFARIHDAEDQIAALSQLKSRRGFERAEAMGSFRDPDVVERSLAQTHHPVTAAYLLPFSRRKASSLLEGTVGSVLSQVTPGSPRHLALVEAVRLVYIRARREEDRADKQKSSPG